MRMRPVQTFIGLVGLTLSVPLGVQAQTAPTLSVDAAANRHVINPNIYGIASYGLDAGFAKEIQVPNVRWGGDGTTRYNWEVDSSNAGFDWYFMGGNGQANPTPSGSADQMISTYKAAGAGALITVPIIPYVNKSSETSCSFPVAVYGAQQSVNPYVQVNGGSCGNSISSSGTQLADTNIYANHVDNTVALQQGWLQHLVATFGTAAKGGVPFYQLDNEPFGWGNTHRDVEPGGTTYPTIVTLGQQYAAIVKQQDPTASVLGPSDFTLGGWIGTPSQQNNLYAGQYYLEQMAAYQQAHGVRILDYFDEHYYPQFSDATTQLASTRTFWDPTYNGGTWVEQYYFDGPMQLIPRFRQWIAQYYPGTRLAFSEYSIDSGHKLITDALAEADVLGIFGWQGVDFANMWNTPAPTDPIAFAFRLYRDYDGAGSQFGDTGIQAASTNAGSLSIYGAERTSDGALTLVVINKTTTAIQTTLSLANFNAAGSAEIYSYSGANLSAITAEGSAPVTAGSVAYSYPAYSATVIVVKGATATQQPIANGTYLLTNGASKLVLDDPGRSMSAGIQMIQWTVNGLVNETWTFSFANGFYTVQNALSKLYLSVPSKSSASLPPLLQEPLPLSGTPASTQQWSITGAAGAWILHNRATGLVIADPYANLKAGTAIITATPNGGSQQSWSIQ